MSQHFLLKPKTNNLPINKICKMSDQEALELCAQMRWGSSTKVICPKCKTRHEAYFLKTRQQWRCKFCKHTFSVTSGTVFASRKLPLQDYLYAIAKMANNNKVTALSLCADLGLQYKNAFTLLHKIRQVMEDKKVMFDNKHIVHIDGLYMGTKDKHRNRKEERINFVKNPPERKRCLLVVRQCYNEREKKILCGKKGGKKTMVFAVETEHSQIIRYIVNKYIAQGATIHSDDWSAYRAQSADHKWRFVSHSTCFQTPDGVDNNQAESYFSRFRQHYKGCIRHCHPKYLENYANESVFREDYRRISHAFKFQKVLRRCLLRSPCADWVGYSMGAKHPKKQEVYLTIEEVTQYYEMQKMNEIVGVI